jgi:hypothetical protein
VVFELGGEGNFYREFEASFALWRVFQGSLFMFGVWNGGFVLKFAIANVSLVAIALFGANLSSKMNRHSESFSCRSFQLRTS